MGEAKTKRSTCLFDRLFAPLERLAAALSDPARRERTMVGTLVVYTAAWTLFAFVSKASQAIHPDAAEIAVLSRALDWGSTKHPPALPALAGMWFAVFPQADFFYHLLAVSMASLSIYVAWHLAGLWLDREKRAAVPFILMLIPSYNFLCLKFDHNTALTAFSVLATYAFVRSFQTRAFSWSVAAGVAAAMALMAKYWSLILLGGLGLAALLDRRRMVYFKSLAPWISAAVAGLCVTPHLVWLYRNHFTTLIHATRIDAGAWDSQAAMLLRFAASPAAYLAIPWTVLTVSSRPSLAALSDMIAPNDNERRLAVMAYLAPFGVALVGAVLVQINLGTLWTASMLSLSPVVLLSSPLVEVSRRTVAGFAAAALAIGIGALAVSPIIAIVALRSNSQADAAHLRLLTAEVERTWRSTTDLPIRLVAGPHHLANVVAFYLPDRPLAFSLFPRLTYDLVIDTAIVRDGFVVVCPANDSYCSGALLKFSPDGRPALRREVELTPTWWGFTGQTRRYTVSIIPPRPIASAR